MQCGITVSGQHSPTGLVFRGISRCLLVMASVMPWGAAVVAPLFVAPAVAMAQEEDAAADGATDPGGELRAWADRHRAEVVLLRPDRYVAALGAAAETNTLLAQFEQAATGGTR